MYPKHLRAHAISLREKGHSLPEITDMLSLPKGTVYSWIRHVPFTQSLEPMRMAQRRASLANSRRAAERRQASYDEATTEASRELSEPALRDFVLIYMCEGYRKSRNTVSVSNSCPKIMRLCTKMMRQLSTKPLKAMVSLHVDQNTAAETSFWAEELDIPISDVTAIFKSNSGKLAGRKWRSPHGVCMVRTHDTAFRSRLQAYMDFLKDSWV